MASINNQQPPGPWTAANASSPSDPESDIHW